jgi:hypothetical protein
LERGGTLLRTARLCRFPPKGRKKEGRVVVKKIIRNVEVIADADVKISAWLSVGVLSAQMKKKRN